MNQINNEFSNNQKVKISDVHQPSDLDVVLGEYRNTFFRYFEDEIIKSREGGPQPDWVAFVEKYGNQIFEKATKGVQAINKLYPEKAIEVGNVVGSFSRMVESYVDHNAVLQPELNDLYRAFYKFHEKYTADHAKEMFRKNEDAGRYWKEGKLQQL